MHPGPASCLVRSLFIFLMSGGGGELPVLDGMLFHERSVAVTLTYHLETGTGCHADQCAIRATAQHPPVTSTVFGPTLQSAEPGGLPPSTITVEPLSAFPVVQPFSRAPPSLQI